jgi:SOS-response transcriptional repressor LexA
MSKLSKGQRAVLDAIRQLTAELGQPPTIPELAERLGTGGSNIWRSLQALEDKGWIARDRQTLSGQATARSIRIVKEE